MRTDSTAKGNLLSVWRLSPQCILESLILFLQYYLDEDEQDVNTYTVDYLYQTLLKAEHKPIDLCVTT